MIELLPNAIEIKVSNKLSLSYSNKSNKSLKEIATEAADQQQSTMPQNEAFNVAQLENLHNNSSASFLELQFKIIEKWNKITTCIIDNQRVVVDRSSWINKNGKPIKYTADTMGYPM